MKKILLLLLAFVSLPGWAQLSEVANFDFQKPSELKPTAVSPSPNNNTYVIISDYTFQDEKISLSFISDNYTGVAEMYTKLIPGYPTQYYVGFSTNARMKFTAQSGSYINKIEFTGSHTDLIVNVGTFNVETNTWTATNSGSSEVIFSNPHTDHPMIYSIKVYYTAPSEIMHYTWAEILDKDGVSVNTYSYSATEIPEVKSFKSLDITFPYSISPLSLGQITMTDGNSQPVGITTSCYGSVLSIAASAPIVEDGDFTISVPQRVVQSGNIQNSALPTFQFKVRKEREIFNPIEVTPAEGNLTVLPEIIKLKFDNDVTLGDLEPSDIVIKKDGTPMYAASLAIDETDQRTVLVKSSHTGNITNDAANLGIWTIDIPAGAVHNPFKGNATLDYWNKALTYTYTLIETPDPLKDKKTEMAGLKEQAAALVAKIGTVGYPKADDATPTLASVKDLEISATDETALDADIANLKAAIKAFYNNPAVALPASQKWYTIASVNKDNQEIPLSYANGAVSLGGTATAFQVESITSEGVAVLKMKVGKDGENNTTYKYLHVLLGADDYNATSSKNVTDAATFVSNLTIGKMTLAGDDVDQTPVAGLLTIKGCVGNDKTTGDKLGEAYAQVTHGATPAVTTSLTETTLFFESGKTNAFRFVETTEPSDEPVTPPTPPTPQTVTPTYSLTEVNTNDHTMTLTIGDVTSATLINASKIKIYKDETDVTSQITASTLIEAAYGSLYQFSIHLDGLAAGIYSLVIGKGTFAFAGDVVIDEGERLSFTIPSSTPDNPTPDNPITPTPSTNDFTKGFEVKSWPMLSGDTPVQDVLLNDVYVFIFRGEKYNDLCVDESKTIELLDGWNDNIKYREGKLVAAPDFVLPEEWGGADPSIKAYRICWNPEVQPGDYANKPFLARIVIPEAAMGNEVFGQYLAGQNVKASDCIVNNRVSLTFKVNNEEAAQEEERTSFFNYKAEKKTEATNKAQEGDSQECAALITAAKAAIDALSYDTTKSLDANKAQVDVIIAKLDADLAAQRAKDAVNTAFADYKIEKKTVATNRAQEGDSQECAALITAAKAAIDALSYDTTKSLDANKELVDAIIAKLDDDLAVQRDIDASKAALNKVIADATAYVESIKGEHKAFADVLDMAINAAKAKLSDVTATKSDLDDAKQTLESAVATIKQAIATGIEEMEVSGGVEGATYYTLDGRKLDGKPTKKGVYIVNGRKVVVK